ncbi:hypothetical protein ARMGADRAFT_327935 [Armillaria gallica]|uniref:Uncharacterized protein n=1 Tax=Armillaria gallica TaxID=47427 RepID=A0A2H3DKM3_ARMGA|nr:hypothetical protein ARMGADRAFT_327935 [Armillaria gallica]
MANIGSEEVIKQEDARVDLKRTELIAEQEPATVECNEQDFWLHDKWPLQAVLANLEKIKATVREKAGEDSEVYPTRRKISFTARQHPLTSLFHYTIILDCFLPGDHFCLMSRQLSGTQSLIVFSAVYFGFSSRLVRLI